MRLRENPLLLRFVLPWLVMLGLMGLELLLMVANVGWACPIVGVVMAMVIVFLPMELPGAPNAAHVFALAGVVWLAIAMFSLGILDPLTRHDLPSYFHSTP